MRSRHRVLFVIVLLSVALLSTSCRTERGDGGESADQTYTPGTTQTDEGVVHPDEGERPIASDPAVDSSSPLGEIVEREIESSRQRAAKVLADADSLSPLLNQFWTVELRRVGLEFDAPDRFEYYRGSGNSPCGGVSNPLPRNAYYCNPDQDEYVAFDIDWFQQYLVDHPSGATTFLILAHEWGHAVQDTWKEQGGKDYWEPAYTRELSADCLAGVFLEASIRDGTIVEEEGDAESILAWLYEGGSSPWLVPGDHGTRDQRRTAFSQGYANGTDYCRQNY